MILVNLRQLRRTLPLESFPLDHLNFEILKLYFLLEHLQVGVRIFGISCLIFNVSSIFQVLHFLANLKLSEIVTYLFPVCIHSAINRISLESKYYCNLY